MTSVTTQIISPTWIAPIIPAGELLTRHSLVIEGDRISAVLPREEALASYSGTTELILEGHLLTQS